MESIKPKDLKAKIGTKEEVFWTNLRDKLEDDNLNHARQIKINDRIIYFAEENIRMEKEKFK